MGQYFQVLLAFLFVLGLIGLMSYALRKFSLESFMMKKNAGAIKQLSIIEILPLDTKRRLVLVKNGKKNHLLLLGINGDVVVESYDE
jgi:flagellar protein FliO/FliZ